MSSKTNLLDQQKSWAMKSGLEPDARGYLAGMESNLLKPLSRRTKLSFERGSGSELQDTPSRPAKMKALHSSSALAVNVFDSWVDRDAARLQEALGLEEEIESVSFEEQFPTGLKGIPPNLDVTLELTQGHTIGIESKFSEWLTPTAKSKVPFKESYFAGGVNLWDKQGLPGSQLLARKMYDGAKSFRYLDAAQLLKHSLGMAVRLGEQFSLYYVYFDWPGPESRIHSEEAAEFADQVGEELRFKTLSYQELFGALEKAEGVDPRYLRYLKRRYFESGPTHLPTP